MHRSGLSETGSLSLLYADQFDVRFYGDCTLIHIENTGDYLLIPEGGKAPDQLPEDVVVLEKPLDTAYLVSSSAADLIEHCGALDCVRLSGVRESDWYNEAIRTAMEEGRIVYAGKYRAPDYEKILAAGCDLAIENTMIYHEPAVKEKLEELGIPVLVERSSYETHPLGRVEWVKFFGALTDREEKAEEIFNSQLEILDNVTSSQNTGKTVAFFYITSNGLVQVRQSTDYIPKMIELAGGRYIFDTLPAPDTNRSTLNMQVEEFYAGAKDADYLIYNTTIDGEVGSLDDLLDKCPVLDDFKAVKDGNVWCTSNYMYQQPMSTGLMIDDFHTLLTGGDEEDMTYLFKLE